MVQRLYAYHEWADIRLLAAASLVAEEELTRRADIPFGSVQGNLLHILGSQVSWVMRLTGEVPQLAKVEPGRVVSALRESYTWAHERLQSCVGSLVNSDLEEPIVFVEFEGNQPHNLQRPLWEVLLSVGSHGMTHRGEVAAVLTRLGASPDQLDYSEFAWRSGLREKIAVQGGAI